MALCRPWSYEWFIALRYLRSKRQTRFVSVITYISVSGVLVGVAALVIVLSLFNGFESHRYSGGTEIYDIFRNIQYIILLSEISYHNDFKCRNGIFPNPNG